LVPDEVEERFVGADGDVGFPWPALVEAQRSNRRGDGAELVDRDVGSVHVILQGVPLGDAVETLGRPTGSATPSSPSMTARRSRSLALSNRGSYSSTTPEEAVASISSTRPLASPAFDSCSCS
jgi:hypothetical protein